MAIFIIWALLGLFLLEVAVSSYFTDIKQEEEIEKEEDVK